MRKKISLNDVVGAFVLLIYFSELVFPPISVIIPSATVCFICFVLWLFICYTTNRSFLLRTENFFYLFVFAILVVIPYLFGYNVIAHRYTNMALVICGSIIMNYYYYMGKMDILKRILIIVGVLAIITMIHTLSELLINPFISRSIKSSGEYSIGLARQGIGGYKFIYFVTALCTPLLYWLLNSKKKLEKIILIGIYVLSVTLVLKSNYMTAFLTIIIGAVVLIVFNAISKDIKTRILGIVAAILIFIVGINIDSIISDFAYILPSRIAEVIVSGEGSSVIDSVVIEFLGDRWPTIQTSINAFLQHPILGLIGSGELSTAGGFLTGFGQHSFVADTYALYGIVGGTLSFIAVIKSTLNKYIWKKRNVLKTTMFIIMILLYCFNNATESIALVFTVIAPFISEIVENQAKA